MRPAVLSLCASALAGSPNLIFMLQDDLGYNDVGFTSGTPSTDPAASANLTALAREGIVLRQHYAHWHCSPSRRSFLTGRLPVHHGELLSDVDGDDVDLRWAWVSDKLKARGYANWWFGKGHTGYKSTRHLPGAHGFDRFYGYLAGAGNYTTLARFDGDHPVHDDPTYSTERFGALALDAVKAQPAGAPFFLYLPWQAVHSPYDLPPRDGGGTCAASDASARCAGALSAMLADADAWAGALVAALRARGLYENTLFVYAADNGGVDDGRTPLGGNNWPLRGEKHTSWQGGVRVAAFVSGGLVPSRFRGTRSDVVSHVADWCARRPRGSGGGSRG